MSILQHIQTLAEQGDAIAQNELGISYMTGRHGVEVDEQQAFYWLEKAAAQGLAAGIFNLGLACQKV